MMHVCVCTVFDFSMYIHFVSLSFKGIESSDIAYWLYCGPHHI